MAIFKLRSLLRNALINIRLLNGDSITMQPGEDRNFAEINSNMRHAQQLGNISIETDLGNSGDGATVADVNAAIDAHLYSVDPHTQYALKTYVQSLLAGKFNTPTGTADQYISGDGQYILFPDITADVLSAIASHTSDSNPHTQYALKTYVDGLISGKEDKANKSPDGTMASNSDVLYPTQKAVVSYVASILSGVSVNGATSTVKGIIKLAGDLGGTADEPRVPGLSDKFNNPNGTADQYIKGDGTLGTFPNTSVPEASISVKGILKLAGDLSGTADLPSVVGLAGKENSSNKSTDSTFSDNSDVLYPTQKAVKSYVQTALLAKFNNPTGTISQYIRGDGSLSTLTKDSVGLGNVNNTSDENKPISSAVQTALNGKAPLVHSHSLATLTDVNIVSPIVDDILKWNGSKWVNSSGAVVNAGPGVTMFLTVTDSGTSGYHYISKSPDSNPEVDEYVTVTSGSSLIGAYISELPIAKTKIDPGIWEFNYFSYIDGSQTASFLTEVYKRTASGVETLLFSVNSQEVSWNSIELANVISVQQGFNCNATDFLVVKIYGYNPSSTSATIHLIHSGNDNYSHFHTPLVLSHNDIAGLQGGTSNEYYHLTSAEYTGSGTGVFVRQSAIDAKENTITSGTTSQYWRGDKTWQTLDKSAVGLSNVDNTSDANKPISSAVQTALNGKVNNTVSINAGSGLSGGGDLTASRTVSMPPVGTAGTYGAANAVPVITTDAQGRVSSATNTAISILSSQVSNFSTSVTSLITSTSSGKHSLKGYVVFTTVGNGTYVPSADVTYVDVLIHGAGGGGGGAQGTNGQCAVGGGGGSGGMLRAFIPLTGAASYSLSVGAGGAGGGNNGGNGGNGGGSSITIGSNYNTNGGYGGNGGASGTTADLSSLAGAGANAGSAGAGGIYVHTNSPGYGGQTGIRFSGSLGLPGKGADSYLGAGGITGGNSGYNGYSAFGYGSGGGGAVSVTNSGKTGGNGANGIIIIAEYYY